MLNTYNNIKNNIDIDIEALMYMCIMLFIILSYY